MSGAGAPRVAVVRGSGVGLRVAVISATWHDTVMGGLRAGAMRALGLAGVDAPLEVEVPGCFELPVAAARIAALRRAPQEWAYDAVVALGVVVRGDTPHFEYVCSAATNGLTEVSVRSGIPVGFGVLTCDTVEQALARAGLEGSREDKGGEAADAAVATALTLRSVGASRPPGPA